MKTLQQLIKDTRPYYQNPDITSAHFPKPKKVQTEGAQLLPIDKYYPNGQAVVDMLKEKGLRPANVYELMEYFTEHKDEMPKGKWYPAFGSMWTDAVGGHRVPFVYAYSGGDFNFGLGRFEGGWDGDRVVLGFGYKSLATQTVKKESLGNSAMKAKAEV